MTLKEKVFEHIKKHGPQTNADLVTKFKVKKASMRRTCGELMKEGKLAPVACEGPRQYGLSSDVRNAETSVPAPSSTYKPDPNFVPKHWSETDFCF